MAVRLRLREILRERHITQTDFAEQCGLSRNSISSIVNQPAQIKLETIEMICNALDIEPEDLFERVKVTPIQH